MAWVLGTIEGSIHFCQTALYVSKMMGRRMLFNKFRLQYMWTQWNEERFELLLDLKGSKKAADKALLKIWDRYDEDVARDLI
jgi:hypothetical protein